MHAERTREEAFERRREEKRRERRRGEEGAGGNHLSAVLTINKAKGILCWLLNKPASPSSTARLPIVNTSQAYVPLVEKATFIAALYLSVQSSSRSATANNQGKQKPEPRKKRN